MPKKEAYGLYYLHDRKHNAYSCSALCIDFAHEEGVGHIIKAGDQHRNDGGQGHSEDNLVYRSLSEKFIIIALRFHTAKVRKRCVMCTDI